jgi:hypothetical protein
MRKIALTAMVCLLAGIVSAGTVADLEALQAASKNIQHQFTFEGTYDSGNGKGSWLDNKAASSPDLVQDGVEDPARMANSENPGYDSSTSFADFSALASGVKGDALKSSAPITYAASGTIEYLVRFGPMNTSSILIGGGGNGANARLRLIMTDSAGSKAQMQMGANVGYDLIGGETSVAYGESGDWYYVAQNWSISGGTVTMDAWVANLTAGGPLTKTINGASNVFEGDTATILNLGGSAKRFAECGLDALAIYNSPLNEAAIISHFKGIATVTNTAAAITPRFDEAAFLASRVRGAAPREIDIYLLGGQSNMDGAGLVQELPEDLQSVPNVQLFQSKRLFSVYPANTWHPMTPASSGAEKFGPEVGLSRVLSMAFPDRTIGLIKHARGGSRLAAKELSYPSGCWHPGTGPDDPKIGGEYRLFYDAVREALAALERQGWSPRIAGMFWVQGEADACSTTAGAQYAANLSHFIRRVREDFNAPGMPFIYARVLPYDSGRQGLSLVQAAMDHIDQDSGHADAVPGAYMVRTDGLGVREDNVHFNTQGQLGLSVRLGQAFLNRSAGLHSSNGELSAWCRKYVVDGAL